MTQTSKQKPRSHQQLLSERDLNSQKHDEILIWLDNNIQSIIDDIFRTDWNQLKEEEKFDELKRLYPENAPNQLPQLPQKPPIKIIRKEWMFVINNQRNTPIGEIDILVEVNLPTLVINHQRDWRIDVSESKATICFDVKSEITSLSKLILEIQLYRKHIDGLYIVVCPDISHQKILQEQRILLLKYPN